MDKENYWRAIISQFELSGLNRTDFCKEHNLKIYTFKYWYLKLGRVAVQSSFVSIRASVPLAPDLEISYPNGVKIRTNPDCSLQTLRALITIL